MKLIDRSFSTAILLIIVGTTIGCYSSRVVEQFDQLEDAYNKVDKIRVLTQDSTLYTFVTFSYTDSTLSGRGKKSYDNNTEDFEGSLDFKEIVFVERLKFNGWKAFWIIPMASVMAGGLFMIAQPAEFNIRRPVGSSCPFIYSYNGSEFILEAEAFSTAMSRSFEAETFHLLPSLRSINDEVKVRIKNERPETHLFNKVKLYAVDAENYASVVLDVEHKAWPVVDPRPAERVFNESGKDVLKLLTEKDESYWKSELKNISIGTGFRDTLEMEFSLPEGASEATFIVDAINTELITEVYAAAGAIIGEESLRFYHALEADPALKKYFEEWILRSSLRVEIKKDDVWVKAGIILPEANEVPFTRAIRLKGLDHQSRKLGMRVISMTDVWHIDALSLDASGADPLKLHALNLKEVKSSTEDSDIQRSIKESDSLYTILMPPEYMDLTFDSMPTRQMENPAFVLSAQGYLYEWFPGNKNDQPAWITEGLSGMDRSEMLEFFKKGEELFLQSIYSKWSNQYAHKQE